MARLSKVKALRISVLLFSVLLLMLSGFWHVRRICNTPAIDYFIFWAVPQISSVAHVANIYGDEDQQKMYSFLKNAAVSPAVSEKQRRALEVVSQLHENTLYAAGTPFLYTVIGSLSSGAYDRDLINFLFFCSLCFILSIIVLCRMLNISIQGTVLLLIFYIAFFSPLLSDVRVGNVNQIQLFVITGVIYFMARSRFWLAGLVLGTGIMFKPNIFIIFLLVAIIAVVDREIRKYLPFLVGSAIGIIISFASSCFFFRRISVWSDFVQILPKTMSVHNPINYGNYGLSMLIDNFANIDPSVFLLGFFLVGFTSVVYRTRKGLNKSAEREKEEVDNTLFEPYVLAGLGSTIMLLTANLVWYHYYIFTIPLSIFLMRPDRKSTHADKYRRAVRIVLIITMFIFSVFTENIFLSEPVQLSAALNTATVIITVFALYELWRRRKSVMPTR